MDDEELEALEATISELIVPAVVRETTDSLSALEAKVQLTEGEIQDDVEVLQGHGIYFRPPANSRGVLLAVTGSTEHRAMVGASHGQYQPVNTCAEGEGGLYGLQGWVVFVDSANVLHIGGGAGRFNGVNEDLDPPPPDVPLDPDGTVLDADPALADDAKAKPAMRIYPDGAVEVLRKDGGVTMRIEPDGTIRLGSEAAADPLVRLSLLEAQLATLQTKYDSHAHIAGTFNIGGTAVVGVSGVPQAIQQLGGAWPGSMGASKVMGE